MNKDEIISLAERFINDSPGNLIKEGVALHQDCVGMKIFEAPIFSFGSAVDELYTKYKSPDIIGSHFMNPVEWMPDAKTVITFFLPYTRQIKDANAKNFQWPSEEWLHGRIEGQVLLRELTIYIVKQLLDAGFNSLSPSLDKRIKSMDDKEKGIFSSNWSERHVAYACGLGTFGLSKGFITKKGVCGRLGSVLTVLDLPKDSKDYEGVYDYCSMCGACITHCPAQAITLEEGKKHYPCSEFLDKTKEKHNPRYGCGKCQVRVPCENGMPVKRMK